MADGIVLYQVDDKVGIITLNRPEKLNAISRELQLALTEAFACADADPATSVVLLRAEGRSFCAGYDIGAQPEGTDDWRSNPTKAHAHLAPQLEFEMAPWLMKKPVVAAVQGHVLGGGCELAMLCDMTIAAEIGIELPPLSPAQKAEIEARFRHRRRQPAGRLGQRHLRGQSAVGAETVRCQPGTRCDRLCARQFRRPAIRRAGNRPQLYRNVCRGGAPEREAALSAHHQAGDHGSSACRCSA